MTIPPTILVLYIYISALSIQLDAIIQDFESVIGHVQQSPYLALLFYLDEILPMGPG